MHCRITAVLDESSWKAYAGEFQKVQGNEYLLMQPNNVLHFSRVIILRDLLGQDLLTNASYYMYLFMENMCTKVQDLRCIFVFQVAFVKV